MLRPPEGGAHCSGADSRRRPAVPMGVVVGFAVDVEIDDSQGLPGIPPRRIGRMKPWGVSSWKIRGRGANHLLDRTGSVGHAVTRPARSPTDHAACSAVAGVADRQRAWPSRRT